MARAYESEGAAQRYDAARGLPPETGALWMRTLAAALPHGFSAGAIADVGAGTGRFASLLQQAFGCPVYAIEPADAMLKEGLSRGFPAVEWRHGSAEALPLADQSVDLVWMSQAFHHLTDPAMAADEMKRVLRPGGYVAVRNGTLENNREIVWLRCFPEAAAVDEARLPSQHAIGSVLVSRGLALRSAQTVYQYFASSYTEYLAKIRQRGLSSLIAISDDAFAAGIARLERWVSEQPHDQAVYEPVDLLLFGPGAA